MTRPDSLWSRLAQVATLFLRLGVTAFGGPAAHIALIERECVQRRKWISRERFLDLLGVANLIPGPTSTELAMHVGHQHAGWPGLVVAGIAFIAPAALLVGALAALYVRMGALPAMQFVLAAVQPVVVVIVLQAVVPLARSALRSVPLGMVAMAVAILAVAGAPEIRLLLAAGMVTMVAGRAPRSGTGAVVVIATLTATATVVAAGSVAPVDGTAAFTYFLRTGSLLFGSGYVLLPVLQGDLVDRLAWLTDRQLLDAIAAGQATPGPVFTTATFVGYLLGGPTIAALATLGIFLPAFVFSAISVGVLDRVRGSAYARAFLDGVNAAAVALIVVVLVTLARAAFAGPLTLAVGILAALFIFVVRLNSSVVLAAAALAGLAAGTISNG